MVYATLTDDMINILKSLKNKEFVSYDCFKENSFSYGNLKLNTGVGAIEITNFEKVLPMYETEEEVACLSCRVMEPGEKFEPECMGPVSRYPVGGMIKEIEVINDIVTVNKRNYAISFDRAIVFKMDTGTLMLSRDVWFSETITISEHDDYNLIYPVEQVVETWSGESDNKVDVIRTVKKL